MADEIIAVLSNSTRVAVDTIRDRIATMDNGQRGTFTDGTSFLIVTREMQLDGRRLIGFEVAGDVTPRLIAAAEARLVN